MNEHDPRFDRWDAAYVLGALSASDRRDYEEHLADCRRCRHDVAELNGLPGLLNRIPADRGRDLLGVRGDAGTRPDSTVGAPALPAGATAPMPEIGRDARVDPLGGPPEPPADLTERLLERHRQRQRRQVWRVVGAGLAAAVVAVVAVLGFRTLSPTTAGTATPPPTLVAELRPSGPGPAPEALSGSVRLYARAWGTEVDTECRHETPAAGAPAGDERYGLFVVDTQGSSMLVSSWRSIPKSPIVTTAATATTIAQMRRLEVRSLPDQTVLLSAPVG